MQNKLIIERTSHHNPILFNGIFWICSFLILLFLFSGKTSPEKIDYIYTVYFVITLSIPVTINLYYLIPRYLKKEKNLAFCVFFIVNLVLFSELNPVFFELIINAFFKDYYFISYHNQLEVYFIFFIFFILSSLLKLAEDWVHLNKVENKVLKAQKQAIENQLYYLKGQINPHFLFNSLNVLYSLAIDKKEEITNAILQLSDILRYVIYDVESEKVTLKKEIELIKNYIEFEKNRHVNATNIRFYFKGNDGQEIYPMLFLPLLENSFKHGLKSGVKNPFVDIHLKEINGKINFTITNNFRENTVAKNNTHKGIGLKNIRENLALIYPEKHQLKTEINDNVFTVNLSIDLKE